MLKHLIAHKLSAFETQWSYSMEYAREILDVGTFVLKRFADAQRLGTYRGGLSAAAHYAVKILAVMDGDCGACVQLVVDMARHDGVPDETVAVVVEGRLDALPDDVRLPATFARALLDRSDALPELRDAMREAHGTAGLVAVAYATIAAGMFPILKTALGHGQQCAMIDVGGRQVPPGRGVTTEAAA